MARGSEKRCYWCSLWQMGPWQWGVAGCTSGSQVQGRHGAGWGGARTPSKLLHSNSDLIRQGEDAAGSSGGCCARQPVTQRRSHMQSRAKPAWAGPRHAPLLRLTQGFALQQVADEQVRQPPLVLVCPHEFVPLHHSSRPCQRECSCQLGSRLSQDACDGREKYSCTCCSTRWRSSSAVVSVRGSAALKEGTAALTNSIT